MAKLNQFAISRALGSTMSAGETPRFGRLGLLPLVARASRPTVPALTAGSLDNKYDAEIKNAFTDVLEKKLGRGRVIGRDRLLADPELVHEFIRMAKKLGVDAPPALINRRLMRLGKIGGILPRATERDPNTSIEDRNAFAIEYGVVRIARLYGATVDDILCEECIGKEYRKVVEALAPGYPALIYRLGALYLRKTRNLQSAKKKVIANLDPAEIERSWVDLGSVEKVNKNNLTKIGPGILHLDEGNRSLYLAKTHSLAGLGSTFLASEFWDAISNHFWHPDTGRIHMKVLPESELGKQAASWELLLIQALEPVFNIKVGKDAA